MLMPSIFGENLFDDFFTPFYYDDKDEKKAEKKLYGRRAQNLLKTDIKEKPEGYELIVDVPGFKKDEVKVALKRILHKQFYKMAEQSSFPSSFIFASASKSVSKSV